MRWCRAFYALIAALVIVAAVMAASSAGARDTSVFSDNPYPCTVLSPYPCHPTFCSVFDPQPCQPDINYPFGQGLRLTIASLTSGERDKNARSQLAVRTKARRQLNTIGDLFAALRRCWVPPDSEHAHRGTEMSVRLSFKRNGELIGEPRVTFVKPGTPADVRKTYLDAILASLKICTPLPLTPGLGGALAGRPISIRFIDDRQ
jgi:hypothetical protein